MALQAEEAFRSLQSTLAAAGDDRSATGTLLVLSNNSSPPPTNNTNCSPSKEEGHQATGDYQRQTRQSIVSDHYEQTYDQVSAQIESAQQLVEERKYSGRPSPERPYPRRPKNRNSNILSAVLCLIKELDGPSLEVAEMAVRCRMEELED